jgi:hypothetical protein
MGRLQGTARIKPPQRASFFGSGGSPRLAPKILGPNGLPVEQRFR